VIGVYIDLGTLFAIGDGLRQVLGLDRKGLARAKTSATKGRYTSDPVAVTTSRCRARCRE
jgi:hypothetical protein